MFSGAVIIQVVTPFGQPTPSWMLLMGSFDQLVTVGRFDLARMFLEWAIRSLMKNKPSRPVHR